MSYNKKKNYIDEGIRYKGLEEVMFEPARKLEAH